MTYTEHEQRLLDQQSGIEMDRVAARMRKVSADTDAQLQQDTTSIVEDMAEILRLLEEMRR
jgi:hypothetical protein